MNRSIKIGTRKSKLALLQTEIVKHRLKSFFPNLQVEIVKMSTKGDQDQNRPACFFWRERSLYKRAGRGTFGWQDRSCGAQCQRSSDGISGRARYLRGYRNEKIPRDVIITRDGTGLSDLAGRRCTWNEQSAPGTAGKADESWNSDQGPAWKCAYENAKIKKRRV